MGLLAFAFAECHMLASVHDLAMNCVATPLGYHGCQADIFYALSNLKNAMEFARPIPGWIPSTPEVRGGAVDGLAQRHLAIAIHFWAPWNGSDPPMERSIQAIAERFAGRVAFFSCNVDLEENIELCKRCHIATVPTLVIWASRELKPPIIGWQPEQEKLAAAIESRLREPE
jgi:hypothetical protein